MARKATCPKCNTFIEKSDNFKVHKNKKYHIKCYKELVNEVYQKSTKNQDSKEELFQYICSLYKINELTTLIKNQIEKYYTEYELTYDGMLYTLKYFYEILENDISKTEGIGIIPYTYKVAKDFYVLKNHLSEVEFDPENIVINKTVKIKPIDYSNKKLIDFENL